MSKIKLVAMDLDNTLLDSEKQISKHTEEVLKEAIRRGVYIVPATGRIFKAIPEIFQAFDMQFAVTGQLFMIRKKIRSYIQIIYQKKRYFRCLIFWKNIIVHVIFIRMGKGIWNDAILTILQSMVYQIMY